MEGEGFFLQARPYGITIHGTMSRGILSSSNGQEISSQLTKKGRSPAPSSMANFHYLPNGTDFMQTIQEISSKIGTGTNTSFPRSFNAQNQKTTTSLRLAVAREAPFFLFWQERPSRCSFMLVTFRPWQLIWSRYSVEIVCSLTDSPMPDLILKDAMYFATTFQMPPFHFPFGTSQSTWC